MVGDLARRVEADPLQYWILENATEDIGVVAHLPMVASRLHGTISRDGAATRAAQTLQVLLTAKLVVVGTGIGNEHVRIEGDRAFDAIVDRSAWLPFDDSSSSRLEYWATDLGEEVYRLAAEIRFSTPSE